MSAPYDLAVIGGGSAGLVGARLAAQLGARVALIEQDRVGGDCTWTGCVPSKALLRAAKAAHEVSHAGRYGIETTPARVDMGRVAASVRGAMETVYRQEDPATLDAEGIDLIAAAATFEGPHVVRAGPREVRARRFLIATGARPALPSIPGLSDVPYLTYQRLFENEILPERLVVLGAGPVGLEIAWAYRRLGADVTVVGERLLEHEEPEVQALVEEMLRREGVRLVSAVALQVGHDGGRFTIRTPAEQLSGDLLLVATGRVPNVEGLALSRAGVAHGPGGVSVDHHLRTSARHIYVAGDVVGGRQFTHLAAWQAFHAVRNALLPGRTVGVTDLVPWVTFLDPEVAHVGLSEAEARARHGDRVRAHRWEMASVDRAVTDGDTTGFIKVVTRPGGQILGASVVATRAGELIGEYALAIRQGLRLADLASTIHPYPTWSTPLQQLAADAVTRESLGDIMGRLALRIAGLRR